MRRLRDAERAGALIDALQAALAAWRPFAGMEDRDFRNGSDTEAIVRVGFRCNQDCGFCRQGRDWPGAPRSVLERWIDEMAAGGVRQLMISGGEPTIYPELLDLVRRARAAGLRPWLQTNAIRMAKPGFAQDSVDAGVEGLSVSYHAGDSALSDLLTRAPGTHVRTEAGIRASLRAGMRVGLNCVVGRRNLPHLPATAERIVAEFVPLTAARADRFVLEPVRSARTGRRRPRPARRGGRSTVRRGADSHQRERARAGRWLLRVPAVRAA